MPPAPFSLSAARLRTTRWAWLCGCGVWLGCASLLHGADRLSPVDQTLQQQEQQRRLDNARQQRLDLQAVDTPPAQADLPARTLPLHADALVCRTVQGVLFEGAATLPAALKQQIDLDHNGRCVTQPDLARLLDSVNDWYVAHGMITSHAWLPEQTLPEGKLVVAAVEGKVGAIAFQPDSPAAAGAVRMALPGLQDKPLNLRDIEQGIEQLERAAQGPVKLKIVAAEEPGYSRLILSGELSPSVRSQVAVDNNGAASTGHTQASASLTLRNALRLDDQISLYATATPGHERYQRSYGAQISLPWGYWTFDYSVSAGRYALPLQFYGSALDYHGSNLQQQISATRTLARDGRSKTDATLSLGHLRSSAFLDEYALQNSGERATTVRLGLNHAWRTGSGYYSVNPMLSRGLPWHSVDQSARGGPAADFSKWSFAANAWLPLAPALSWQSALYAQWSPDTLYSSERLTVGSETSVRGFKDQYLYGESGGYWRNEIDWQLDAPWLGPVTLLGALDAGRITPIAGEPLSGGNVIGAAVGARASFRGIAASLLIGSPLYAPVRLEADPVTFNVQLGAAF